MIFCKGVGVEVTIFFFKVGKVVSWCICLVKGMEPQYIAKSYFQDVDRYVWKKMF